MRSIVLPAVALGLIAAGASAQTPPASPGGGVAGEIVAAHPWARATPPNARTGAAYVTLTEQGPDDRLIGASTPVAGVAEVHQSTNDNGVMKMRPVDGLALETGKSVTLAPGGYHIMMMDLQHPLKAGDSFPLTLRFARAVPMTLDVKVEGIGAAAAPIDHDAAHAGGVAK